MTRSSDGLARVAISAIVVVVLLSQAVAGFVDTGRWGWPILAYPMYETAHFEGDRLDHDVTAYAVLSDARRIEVTRSDLNMGFWVFWYNVVMPIEHQRLDLLEPVIGRYCGQFDGQVTALQLEDKGIAIGRDGPVEGLPPEVIATAKITCP